MKLNQIYKKEYNSIMSGQSSHSTIIAYAKLRTSRAIIGQAFTQYKFASVLGNQTSWPIIASN